MAIAMRYGSGSRSGGSSGGGGITMTLLWTNPSPTASFAAQTVALDLSGYDAILFSYHNFATSNSAYSLENAFCIKGDTTYAGINARDNNRDGGRLITVSDSGVDIGAMIYNGGTNNGYGIPYKIYGIKGIT